jgi:hypothetical protein
MLRASGASRNEANRFKGANPLKVLDIVNKYQATVSRLSESWNVEEADIIGGMAESEKDSETIFESI